MRTAALDVGDARIGVAISDELGLTARGLGTIERTGGLRDLEAVARLLAPWWPLRLVVGLPLNMDGSEGSQAARTRAFAERLAQHLGIEVLFWDERLTTVEAAERLRASGMRRARRRAAIDQEAAAVILESFLHGS